MIRIAMNNPMITIAPIEDVNNLELRLVKMLCITISPGLVV